MLSKRSARPAQPSLHICLEPCRTHSFPETHIRLSRACIPSSNPGIRPVNAPAAAQHCNLRRRRRIRFYSVPPPSRGGPGNAMHRIAICLILLCASPLAFGRDARPSGEVGDCRDSVITVPSPAPATAKRSASAVHKARPAATTAPPPAVAAATMPAACRACRAGTASCPACSADRIAVPPAAGSVPARAGRHSRTRLAIRARACAGSRRSRPNARRACADSPRCSCGARRSSRSPGCRLDDRDRLLLAALCCLPLLEFGAEACTAGRNCWCTRMRSAPSAATSTPPACCTRRGRTDRRGTGTRPAGAVLGPMSKPTSRRRATAFCVAVHEMGAQARRARRRDGRHPPLPRDWQKRWASDFQRAYDALCERVDAGRRVAIDDYAAESPEEFFAVCSEYHFSDRARCAARCRRWRRTWSGSTGRRRFDLLPLRAAQGEVGRGWMIHPSPASPSPSAKGRSENQGRREPRGEARAAEFGRRADLERAAITLHDVLHDGRADAVACTRSSPRTPRCSTAAMRSGGMPGPSSSTRSTRPRG